jgi:hypothetical protein
MGGSELPEAVVIRSLDTTRRGTGVQKHDLRDFVELDSPEPEASGIVLLALRRLRCAGREATVADELLASKKRRFV